MAAPLSATFKMCICGKHGNIVCTNGVQAVCYSRWGAARALEIFQADGHISDQFDVKELHTETASAPLKERCRSVGQVVVEGLLHEILVDFNVYTHTGGKWICAPHPPPPDFSP